VWKGNAAQHQIGTLRPSTITNPLLLKGREMSDQEEQLERVSARIEPLVREFVEVKYEGQQRFHIGELIDFVLKATQSAPTSPDRMLRKLRKDGFCNYRVVDRRKSIYEITALSA
jgi:hypothetical protein